MSWREIVGGWKHDIVGGWNYDIVGGARDIVGARQLVGSHTGGPPGWPPRNPPQGPGQPYWPYPIRYYGQSWQFNPQNWWNDPYTQFLRPGLENEPNLGTRTRQNLGTHVSGASGRSGCGELG